MPIARPDATAAGTRERLILAAERLIAEQGMSVSNRQIGEAAGQANNSVVGYHFGTKTELVLAIVRHHAIDIERRRSEQLAALPAGPDLAAWLGVVVRPITDHIASLGTPSFYARFVAQATASPAFGELLRDETLAAASMQAPFERVSALLGELPREVYEERTDMTRFLVVQGCAERERALHLKLPTPRASWVEAGQGIVDALVGLWQAPVRSTRKPARKHRTPS